MNGIVFFPAIQSILCIALFSCICGIECLSSIFDTNRQRLVTKDVLNPLTFVFFFTIIKYIITKKKLILQSYAF